MIQIEIEVEATDGGLDFDLMNTASVQPGQKVHAPGGGEITWQGRTMLKGAGLPETISLLVSFAKDVATAIFAGWLYDTLKGRARRLRINHLEIGLDRNQIERAIRNLVDDEQMRKTAQEGLGVTKPVRLSAHAQGYLHRRGFSIAEVEEVIRTVPWERAEAGRHECRLDFPFSQTWNGKRYGRKQVRPVFVEEETEILVVTVYTYYF